MKYHGHVIKKVYEDLGDWDGHNYIYEIYKENEWIANAPALSMAKEYIDSGYKDCYLG